MAGDKIMVWVAALLLAGASGVTYGEELSDAAVRDMLQNSDEWTADRSATRQRIVACGARATDVILDLLTTVRYRSGGTRRAGTAPSVRADSVSNPDRLIELIVQIDAPVPVDRLCDFVERGLQQSGYGTGGCLDAALSVLATSGHAKARAYIQYVRDCTARSFDPDDRFWTVRLDGCLQAWEVNARFIRTGQVPAGQTILEPFISYRIPKSIPYTPSACTLAMRRAFVRDAKVLAWEGDLDEKYMAARLPAVLPAVADRTQFILVDPAVLGRLYEPVLAPLCLEWHEGRKRPLEALLGGPLLSAERAGSRAEREALVPLIRLMTGDIALRIKKEIVLNQMSPVNDHSVMLACHDPNLWLGDLLKNNPLASGVPQLRAGVVLRGLSDLKRPLTVEERAALPALLTQPRVQIFNWRDWINGDKDAGLRPLARRESQTFRDALKATHLGSAVIDAILAEKLYDDKQVVFDRIEYAMVHDRDRNIERPATQPDLQARLDKMPPDVRARVEERMKGRTPAPARRNVNFDWLDLVSCDFRDDIDGVKFLRSLAAKEEFQAEKGTINGRVDDMVKLHPDWR